MMFTTATNPPTCYASVARYYAKKHERGFHTTVVTDGDYAYTSWYGFYSGGQGAFHRRGTRWCLLVNGGGAMNVDELVHYGVPRPSAERLFAKMRRLQPT